MKKMKILVIALIMLMIFGSTLSTVSFSPKIQGVSKITRSNFEHISNTFVIDQNTTDPLTGEKGRYGFDSSLIIDGSGKLIVKNATVYFLADIAHPRSLIVYGSLVMYNATLTLSSSQIQPSYHMNVTINGSINQSAKISITNSMFLYGGWFRVINKSNNINIDNTEFNKMPGGTAYGPTPYFENSTVYMENASFKNLFEHSSSGVVNIGNMTDTSGANATSSSGGVLTNFSENQNPEYSSYWNEVPVKELDIAANYSTSSNYDNSSELQLIYRNTVLMSTPLQLSVNSTVIFLKNTTFGSADLTAEKIWKYYNSGELKVEVTQVHYSGSVTVHSVSLNFFIEKNVIIYGIDRFNFNMVNSTVYAKDLYVAANFGLGYGVNHHQISLTNDSKLYVLNLTVENTPNKLDSCIYSGDNQSQVYIFRYAKINVTFNKIPISGLYVNATPYLVGNSLRANVLAETSNFITHINYGNISGNTIYAITNSNGYAYLPLMSDIVNQSEWPNSRFVGVYNLWVNNTTGTNYFITQIGLDHFPDLQISNNTYAYNAQIPYYKHVDVSVTSKVITPSPYVAGNNFSFEATVKNNGTEVANNVILYVDLNGVLVDKREIYSMGAGEMQNFVFVIPGSMLTANGKYNITVEVQQKWDTNPKNNVSKISIQVGQLVVSDWNIGKLIRKHTGNISLDVYSYYGLSHTNVRLYINSTLLDSWTSLYAGDTHLNYIWQVNGTAGWHTLYLYVNSTLIGKNNIFIYKDVDIGINSVNVEPNKIFVSEIATIVINATNYGEDIPTATSIRVNVYGPYNNPVMNQSLPFTTVGGKVFTLHYTPTVSGLYSVYVTVVSNEDYNSNNNIKNINFQVYPTPFRVTPPSGYVAINGTTVKIAVSVTSTVKDAINVNMFIQPLDITLYPSNINNRVNISENGKIMLVFNLAPAQYQVLLKTRIMYNVMYFVKIQSNTTQTNYSFGPFYFMLKEKPNFQVVKGSLLIERNNKVLNNLHVAEGVPVKITFMLRNTGGVAANVTYIITDNNKTIKQGMIKLLGPGDMYNISFNYTIYGVGLHMINVTANPYKNVTEKTYADNKQSVNIHVIPPVMEITYSIISKEHGNKIYEGDHIIVIVDIINKNATEAQGRNVYMKNVKVTVSFGAIGTYYGTTNNVGVARIEFVAKKTGTFTPSISTEYYGERSTASSSSSYQVLSKPFVIPWLWIIIAGIIAGIGLFFLYGYVSFKKESKNYMVCGNCGHLIPADAEKCPYCGVVFEKDKVQCPDCGSWIDEDSKYCPVCGSVFLGTEEEGYDKYISLRERYEQYLTKYKEEAKKYIGESYSTEEFFKWWKTHPEFVSFQEWEKRQEEEIEGETVKCPVCGALNPKDSRICRVCGSLLPTEEENKENTETKQSEKAKTVEGDNEKSIMEQYKEEYEKIKHPGVISFEEWVKRKKADREKEVESEPPTSTKKEISNKLASPAEPKVDREKVEEKVKAGYVKCPVCGALNKPDAKVCAVCGSPLKNTGSGTKEQKERQKPVVKRRVIKKVVTVEKEKNNK